jgi:hypothetical protein
MDEVARVRMQIRAVLVVYRAEIARLNRSNLSPATREAFATSLKTRSFQVLDDARASLDGDAPDHKDLIGEIEEARTQISAGG